MSDNKWFIPETYEDFRELATNDDLSVYEKIGFPNSYRIGFESKIFRDILTKLTKLSKLKAKILDIGPGVSELPKFIIDLAIANNSQIFLLDSVEMLNQLPSNINVTKIPGKFPEVATSLDMKTQEFDAILMYSVIQYIAFESSLLGAIDVALDLLAPGGQILIGDIPNLSMRKRFFSSDSGVRFHQEFMKTSEKPQVDLYDYPKNSLDDSVIFSILFRARNRGFHAYCLPQAAQLPFSNRREDILIERP